MLLLRRHRRCSRYSSLVGSTGTPPHRDPINGRLDFHASDALPPPSGAVNPNIKGKASWCGGEARARVLAHNHVRVSSVREMKRVKEEGQGGRSVLCPEGRRHPNVNRWGDTPPWSGNCVTQGGGGIIIILSFRTLRWCLSVVCGNVVDVNYPGWHL